VGGELGECTCSIVVGSGVPGRYFSANSHAPHR
jgi:hypothetical protein